MRLTEVIKSIREDNVDVSEIKKSANALCKISEFSEHGEFTEWKEDIDKKEANRIKKDFKKLAQSFDVEDDESIFRFAYAIKKAGDRIESTEELEKIASEILEIFEE